MKILVSGHAGFLGTHFMRYLADQDRHEIWGVDIRPSEEFPGTVQDIVAFLDDFDEKIDLAIHLAAPVGGREKIEGDPMYNADSLRIDSALFRWATKHCPQVVYPSSSAVYPVMFQMDDDEIHRLTEDMFHPANPSWFAPDEMYGFTKLAGEVLAWKSAGYGVSTLCIRPFSGYGPGQSSDYPVPSIARRALEFQDPLVVWGSGRQMRDFIHVWDLVRGTMKIVEHGWTGYQNVNLGSGIGIRFVDIALILADLMGYEPTIECDPTKPQGVANRVCDTQKMLRAYRPTVDIRQGLRTVLDSLA